MRSRVLPLLICLLGFGLLVYQLGEASLWADETRTVEWVQRLLEGGFGTLVDETVVHRLSHPPLYFLCLGLWIRLVGDSEFSLRFLSVVFGVLPIAIVYPLGVRVMNRRVGLAAMALMALSPFLTMYSRMTRLYSLELLLCLLSCWFFFRLLERPSSRRAWLGYTACSTLALYTDYFVAFVLVSQLAVAFTRITGDRRFTLRIIGGQVAVLLLFAPWIPHTLTLAIKIGRAQDAFTGINSLINWALAVVHPFFAWMVGETIYPWNPYAVVGLIVGALLTARGLIVVRKASGSWAARVAELGEAGDHSPAREWDRALALLWFILLPLSMTIVANRLLLSEKSFLDVANKAVFCAPFMYLMMATGLQSFSDRGWRLFLFVGLALPLGLSLSNYYTGREFHNPTQALPAREMARTIVAQSAPGDVIVSDATVGFYHYVNKEHPEAVHFFATDAPAARNYIEEHQAPRVWLILLCRAVETESRASVELVPWLLDAGYSLDSSQGYAPLDATYARLQGLILRIPICEFKVMVDSYSRP